MPFPKTEIELSISERFRKIARAFPGRPAVREPGRVTSYSELEACADAVAAALTVRLAGAPGPVALLLEAGAPLFSAMLGTLSAGRFYVPLDPRLPDARLEAILGGLDAAAIVAGAATADRAGRLAPPGVPVLPVEELASGGAALDAARAVSPDDLAYVLFTSGSTGRPKGVMQSHRNLLHNVMTLVSGLGIGPEDRLTLLSSPSFGASVSDIFGALLTGASVCPHDLSGEGLRRLPQFLEREGITIYHSVPSVFRSFSSTLDGREDLSKLRAIRLGGEPVLASDFELYRNRFPRTCAFHVGLGATEMHAICRWSARHDTPWPGGAPLGYAVEGTEVVLLGENGEPAGDEGEIGVMASTLAVGYWKDPALTASTFLPVPGRPGVRLYRTGDLGRMRPDGLLFHRGRKDARLKVRGHRVETAEVEAALLALPGVREAAVEGREKPEGVRLTAWVVRAERAGPGVGALRRTLSQRLPASMVPSSFVFLDALPRTGSGKVDRQALPAPGASRPALETAFREPASEPEAAAARAFAAVLGLDRVGTDDDFFELGGDSLSAVELLASLSDALGAELTVADLLEAPTPAGLAARASAAAPPAALVRLREGKGRPVFIVPGGAGDGEDLFAARRVARMTGGAFPFLCLRSGVPPHPPVEQLAERGAREIRGAQPEGPYVLVGDCMGGILAWAIALRLREDGETVALLALLDAPFPAAGRRLRAWVRSHAPRADGLLRRLVYFGQRLRDHAAVLRSLPHGRLAYLARVAGTGARGLAPPENARQQQALGRRASYVGSLLAWTPGRYEGTVHLVECEESRRRGYAEAWSRLASESRVSRVAGDHEGFILERGEEVAAMLTRWLEREVCSR